MKRLKRIASSTQIPETPKVIFTTEDLLSMLCIIKEMTGYDINIETNPTGESSLIIGEKTYPLS